MSKQMICHAPEFLQTRSMELNYSLKLKLTHESYHASALRLKRLLAVVNYFDVRLMW